MEVSGRELRLRNTASEWLKSVCVGADDFQTDHGWSHYKTGTPDLSVGRYVPRGGEQDRDAPRPGPGSKEQEVRKPCIPVSLLSYPCASKPPMHLGLRILLCPVRELDKKVTRSPSAQGILDSSRIRNIKAVAPWLSLRPLRNCCPCKARRRTPGFVAVGTDFA